MPRARPAPSRHGLVHEDRPETRPKPPFRPFRNPSRNDRKAHQRIEFAGFGRFSLNSSPQAWATPGNARRERRGPAATELRIETGLEGWPASAPRSASAALLLAALLRLARDNFERASNPLVRADESTQKPQDVNDNGYDADTIDYDK